MERFEFVAERLKKMAEGMTGESRDCLMEAWHQIIKPHQPEENISIDIILDKLNLAVTYDPSIAADVENIKNLIDGE